MSKEFIFSDFKKLETNAEKVEYLRQLSTLNLSLDINYKKLIQVWSLSD